ncbi:MAG: hypothetical protein AB1847_20870 [bacterium]
MKDDNRSMQMSDKNNKLKLTELDSDDLGIVSGARPRQYPCSCCCMGDSNVYFDSAYTPSTAS